MFTKSILKKRGSFPKAIVFLLCFSLLLTFFSACNTSTLPSKDSEDNLTDDIITDSGNEDKDSTDSESSGDPDTDQENADSEASTDDQISDGETTGEDTTDDEIVDEETGEDTTNDEIIDKEPVESEVIGGEEPDDDIADAKPVLDLTDVEPILYTDLKIDYQYVLGNGNQLFKFMNKSKESFLGICKQFSDEKYELYGYNEMGNVLSATYTNSGLMMHVYWIGGEMNELAVAKGWINRGALPPAEPNVTTGEHNTIITQMRAVENDPSTQINGMGYVIRLADGSFIIYDGGYATRVDELWNTLTSLNGSEKDIVIRAWLMTHSHGDHKACFDAFSIKYASEVTLERLLISPVGGSDYNWYTTRISRFRSARLLCVHTGMVFTFCDVKMEILCSADEIYFDGASDDFNNTSIVSRIYKDGGKSCMLLGDAGDDVSTRLIPMYGDYLQSDICQAAHHGVEDFTIEAYRLIRSAVWLYPCNTYLYNLKNRDAAVRAEIKDAEYTKRIYLHDAKRRPEISLN